MSLLIHYESIYIWLLRLFFISDVMAFAGTYRMVTYFILGYGSLPSQRAAYGWLLIRSHLAKPVVSLFVYASIC
ncbi:MAG: hypothetical protein ACJASB_000358 [Shewanella psychromarinicola]|jgi:hypothetical protein